jgi:hypothetical protein
MGREARTLLVVQVAHPRRQMTGFESRNLIFGERPPVESSPLQGSAQGGSCQDTVPPNLQPSANFRAHLPGPSTRRASWDHRPHLALMLAICQRLPPIAIPACFRPQRYFLNRGMGQAVPGRPAPPVSVWSFKTGKLLLLKPLGRIRPTEKVLVHPVCALRLLVFHH